MFGKTKSQPSEAGVIWRGGARKRRGFSPKAETERHGLCDDAMAITYNNLYLDIRQQLKKAGMPLKEGVLTVEDMVATYDCVAGVNGGGFEDPNGAGKGGIPKGMVVVNGETDYCVEGRSYEFVGFDDQYVLHTGKMTPEDARNKNILVIGGSGSGKTRFFVKPNLMQMHRRLLKNILMVQL